jgi:hypothetical protein
MNRRLKAILFYLVDVRSIILAFAVFNFILVWRWDAQITFACVVCPWYHPWSYLNEPTILLVAALFLRFNQWWGNTTAFVLAGYLIGSFIYLLWRIEDPVAGLRGDWRLIRMHYPYIVGSWDSQYLFALIILCCSIFAWRGLYFASTRYIARRITNRWTRAAGAPPATSSVRRRVL